VSRHEAPLRYPRLRFLGLAGVIFVLAAGMVIFGLHLLGAL
jgi:hypothetical protein